jgi:hypothetical protein
MRIYMQPFGVWHDSGFEFQQMLSLGRFDAKRMAFSQSIGTPSG